ADVRGATAPCFAPALRLPTAGRRRAEKLGGAQGAELRPERETHGGGGRGQSAVLRVLRRQHSGRRIRWRACGHVRPGCVDDAFRRGGATREGASAFRTVRREVEGRVAPGALGQAGETTAVVVVQGTRCVCWQA